jgi:hypothetical protein
MTAVTTGIAALAITHTSVPTAVITMHKAMTIGGMSGSGVSDMRVRCVPGINGNIVSDAKTGGAMMIVTQIGITTDISAFADSSSVPSDEATAE